MGDPLFSVVIPAYGRADFLARALRSVHAQTFDSYEIVVVDDGSDPPLHDTIAPDLIHKVCYLRKPNGGGASARNRGVRMARGELIAFLDHDDEFLPDKLAHHEKAMEDGEAILSYCRARRVDADGALKDVLPEQGASGWVFDALVQKSIIRGFSSAVVRRAAMLEAGGLNESYQIIDDYELYFRLARLGPFRFIPEVLSQTHLHTSNTSNQRLGLHLEYARLFDSLSRDAHGRLGPRLRRLRRLRRKLAYHRRKAGDKLMESGARAQALREYRRALAADPLSSTGVGRFVGAVVRR